MNGRTRALGDTTAVFGLKVLQAALMFVTSAVVSRGLGPEGRGVYYTPLLAATTAIAFSHLGVQQTNVYLFGSRRAPLQKLVAQSGLIALAAGTLGGLLLVSLAALDLRFFDEVPRAFVHVAGLIVPFGVYTTLATGLLTVQGRVAAPFVVSTLVGVVQLLVLGIFAAAGPFTPGVVFATAAGTVVVTSIILAMTLARGIRLVAWDRPLLRATLAHSLVIHAGAILLFLHLRADMFMVKTMMGVSALGVYSLAVVMAETAMMLADSAGIALTSRQMEGTLRDAATTALAGARMFALAGVLIIAGWALLGSSVIRLVFGREFIGVHPPLLILLPGIVLLGMQRICGPTVLRTGQAWKLTGLWAAGFVANIVLNLWWIPRVGLAGAAAASTVSYALMAAIVLAWTSRLAQTSVLAVLPRQADLRQIITTLGAPVRRAGGDNVSALK